MALTEAEELELLELENANAAAAKGGTPAEGLAKWRDVPLNAVKDVGEIAVGLPVLAGYLAMKGFTLPQELRDSALDVLMGKDIKQTAIGQDVSKLFNTQKEMIKGVGEEVLHPVESFKKHPVQTAADIIGIAIPAARGAGKLAGKGAGIAGKAAISTVLGPSMKDIGARFARNTEIRAAKPFDILAKELPDDVARLSDMVSEQSGKALDTLSPSKYLMEGATAKDTILDAIKTAGRDLGRGVSDATVQAKKALARYGTRLRRMGNTVSESELGKIIRDIDNDINWEAPEMTPLNNSLEGVRTKIDGILKSENTAYRDAMIPVAENTRLLKKAGRLFSLKRVPGKGYEPSNATAAALRGSIKEMRVESRDVLGKLKEVSGRDYLREAENAAVAESFAGGKTQGSRRVLSGAVLGGGVGGYVGGGAGGTLGAMLGAAGGAYLDTQGGRVAGSLIDALVKTGSAVPSASPNFQRLLNVSRNVALPAVASEMAPRRFGFSSALDLLQPGTQMLPAEELEKRKRRK